MLEMKAMLLPSGDHVGFMPLSGSDVIGRIARVTASMTYTSRFIWNAIEWPSREYCGAQTLPSDVSRCASLPSAFIT